MVTVGLGLSLLTTIVPQGAFCAGETSEQRQERGKAETVQESQQFLRAEDGYFLLNGKPVFLLTAEFPYYRIPASEWADRLDKVKAAGMRK